MSNNIKDNMYIGYIIMTIFGFSVIGLYIYKNNFLTKDKKSEEGSQYEKQSLLNKEIKENQNHRRKMISDVNTNEIYYPEKYQYGYFRNSDTGNTTVLEENKDCIINVENHPQQNFSMEIDIEAQDKKKNNSDEDEIENDNNIKTDFNGISVSIEKNEEISDTNKEFDWLVVD